MKIPKIKLAMRHKGPGRPKGSPNKPKDENAPIKPKLPKELQELMAKKIDVVTDRLVDELNKQSMLVNENLDYKYLMKLVRLVDCNKDLEISITTKDGCHIDIRNRPEDYKMDSWEDLMESLPEDTRGNITIG